MYCSKCGTKNADGAKFCTECGARLTADETSEPEPDSSYDYYDYPPVRERPRRRKWPAVLFILLIIAIAYFAMTLPTGVYIYSGLTIKGNTSFSKQEKAEFEAAFENTYAFLTADDSYAILNPATGLGSDEKTLKESDEFTCEFSNNDFCVYVELTLKDSGDTIILSYTKPTLKEYWYFVSKTHTWF